MKYFLKSMHICPGGHNLLPPFQQLIRYIAAHIARSACYYYFHDLPVSLLMISVACCINSINLVNSALPICSSSSSMLR
ncbi:hypothetical protein D3C72_2205050 [compost metagenome]